MSEQQLKWVRQQSWYISDHAILGKVIVLVWDSVDNASGLVIGVKERDFTDFNKLVEWAGLG